MLKLGQAGEKGCGIKMYFVHLLGSHMTTMTTATNS